jgi:hypothetical protein
MSARFADDDETQLKAEQIADSVCFGLSEIHRTCNEVSMGKFTMESGASRNKITLRRILKSMSYLVRPALASPLGLGRRSHGRSAAAKAVHLGGRRARGPHGALPIRAHGGAFVHDRQAQRVHLDALAA